MKEYRIEERYFIGGTSEFLPQFKDDVWKYFVKSINGVLVAIKFDEYKDALAYINLDQQGLSADPLVITYHYIKSVKNV
jgi:hypothetical protein